MENYDTKEKELELQAGKGGGAPPKTALRLLLRSLACRFRRLAQPISSRGRDGSVCCNRACGRRGRPTSSFWNSPRSIADCSGRSQNQTDRRELNRAAPNPYRSWSAFQTALTRRGNADNFWPRSFPSPARPPLCRSPAQRLNESRHFRFSKRSDAPPTAAGAEFSPDPKSNHLCRRSRLPLFWCPAVSPYRAPAGPSTLSPAASALSLSRCAPESCLRALPTGSRKFQTEPRLCSPANLSAPVGRRRCWRSNV